MQTTSLPGADRVSAVIASISVRHPGAHDLVTDGLYLDLRHALRNPADDPTMRHRTGLDPDVRAHVLATPGAREVIERTTVQLLALADEMPVGKVVRLMMCLLLVRLTKAVELVPDRLAQQVVLRSECVLLVGPSLAGIEPHRHSHQVGRLPLEPGPYVRMQEPIGVPQDLQIDPPESRIQVTRCPLDRFPELVHLGQESQPLVPGQVRQPLHLRIIHQEHRVARQELHIADHCESRAQAPQNRGVLASQGTPDPIHPPVINHGQNLPDRDHHPGWAHRDIAVTASS